jgi:hypothetical protein
VYQATDTKLKRQVALKILPEAFSADPDRLARFQREAQVLASLNHSGIAAIYGIEEQDTRALVLELVEGPTLADRIAKGPIPVDEALPIAKQLAEALEAAHEAGVIHRDLKPANIKVREDGTVKVLDFGLAKALDATPEGDPSQSPTLTATATQMGVIMGTPAYMSPEQVSGKAVDKRADIWAFGTVLYEMLTAQRLFAAEDVSHTLAHVLTREVEWTALPNDTPEVVRRLLRRSLERDPRKRMRDIGEARQELEELTQHRAWSYRSKRTVWGVPLVHVSFGGWPGARGIIAIGDVAIGLIAVGGFAFGGFTLGGLSLGIVSVGGAAAGLLLAIGGIAFGGFAIGDVAFGVVATGVLPFAALNISRSASGWRSKPKKLQSWAGTARVGGLFSSETSRPQASETYWRRLAEFFLRVTERK